MDGQQLQLERPRQIDHASIESGEVTRDMYVRPRRIPAGRTESRDATPPRCRNFPRNRKEQREVMFAWPRKAPHGHTDSGQVRARQP